MGVGTWLLLLVTHPNEFRTLVQFWLHHESKRDITDESEHATSGWNRDSMRKCWGFLDATSRSFSAVIKELDGDLARAICLFYLVLRGLDTIEDDMSIPNDKKQKLLRRFHELTLTEGWTFTENGPNEKDRQLLVEYDCVVTELNLLEPGYKKVIVDICQKMENGMADFAHKAAVSKGPVYVETAEEYDLYCHYVAGLVGEGLSGIFSASGKEAPWLATQLELSNSMGLLLQKTNIIRDFREDTDDSRFFWPREIWGAFGFTDMAEMRLGPGIDVKEGVKERALWVQSAMILDAMRHLVDALDYLRVLKNQTVFNFCAIPATMAIATLELCFMNPAMFERNIKIRKAEAADLIMKSTNPREVAYILRDFCRKIHARSSPKDPSFMALSLTCGQIEQWCEHQYPSFIQLNASQGGGTSTSMNPADQRSQIVLADTEKEKAYKREARYRQLGLNPNAPMPAAESAGLPWEMFLMIGVMIGAVGLISVGVIFAVLWWFPESK